MEKYINIVKSKSIDNKYLKWWENIIRRSDNRQTQEYCEKHHVVPRSFKIVNKNDKNNLAILTAREHILVHMLMIKFINKEFRNSCLQAFHCMCFQNNGGSNKRFPSVRQLAYARECSSIANSYPRGRKETPKWMPNKTMKECVTELQKYVDQGLSDKLISAKYNTSNTSVYNWRKIYNITNRRPLLRDKHYLYEQYITLNKTPDELAIALNCTSAAVIGYLKQFNIKIKTDGHINGGVKLANKAFNLNLEFFGFKDKQEFINFAERNRIELSTSKTTCRTLCNLSPKKVLNLNKMMQIVRLVLAR